MYYHTLEHKYYSTYSQGFHFKGFTNDVCRPRAYKAATYRNDNPEWKLTDEIEASNGTPPESWGKRMAGVAGVTHVPANITDKKTADAICEYLNANPEPKHPKLTQAVLDRALTALGYGTLGEYLVPAPTAPHTAIPTNQFKPVSDSFNPNRYIRQSKKGTFTVSFRGVSIPQLPSRQAAIDTVNAIRQGFAINAEDVRAYAIAATQLEDLA